MAVLSIRNLLSICAPKKRWLDLEPPIAEGTNIQCGMCSVVFPNKEQFLKHSMKVGQFYTCCKCKAKFRTSGVLYQHYDVHTPGEVDTFDVLDGNEGVILNYEDDEDILAPPSTNDSNELLYILDDSACINEVVIQEEGQHSVARTLSRPGQEIIDIVNLEHGYVLPNSQVVTTEEVVENEDGQLFLRDIQLPSTSRKVFAPKSRNPQPKKRHAVPDFSATNYISMEATAEVQVPHYKCLRCEQLFINKFGFSRHIEKGKCYINSCDACTATFMKNSDFYAHYVVQHTDRAVCYFCFRTFMYEKNVKEHMMRHLDQFRHRCEDCNKGFYTVREYRNHYKNRHMGIRHKCDFCDRSFSDEYYFKRHIATHEKASSNFSVLQISD